MIPPSLLQLCSRAIFHLVECDAESRRQLIGLDIDLLHNIVPLLPPFLLELVQQDAGYVAWFPSRCSKSQREEWKVSKRSFDAMMHGNDICCLNCVWKQHFDRRWPFGFKKHKYKAFLSQSEVELLNLCEDKAASNWRQCFWEAHLQECLNEAVAQVSASPSERCLDDITISRDLLQKSGYDLSRYSTSKVSSILSLKYHCQLFGHHVKYLRLRGALCTKDLSGLLSACVKIRHLVLSHIVTDLQVDGLCLLLNQVKRTLIVLEFQHCRFSQDKLSQIHVSLMVDGADIHCLHLFVLSSSTFFDAKTASLQFIKFLNASRNMQSLLLHDNQFGIDTAKNIFLTALDELPHLSLLSLCDNELDGFSMIKSRDGCFAALQSLDLRSNKINVDGIKEILPLLDMMPVLYRIDLSENPIGDEGLRAFSSKLDMLHLQEVRISACSVSKDAACFLFESLISHKHTLKALKISHNPLGRSIAIPLAKFLQHGLVERLDIGDVGLGAGGCVDFQDALEGIPNLSHLVLRENRLGFTAATLISKLRAKSNSLKLIDCSSNLLDSQCLANIACQLKVQPNVGDVLELIDLRHNLSDNLEAFKDIKQPTILLSEVGNLFDDDP